MLLKPGIITPSSAEAGGSCGTSRWLPSTPIRKLFAGVPPALQAPARLGVLQTERSPNPIPSEGGRTVLTPLMRSKARAQPARITVLRFPKTLLRKSLLNDGFQAAARRGPTLV